LELKKEALFDLEGVPCPKGEIGTSEDGKKIIRSRGKKSCGEKAS